jgi:hypothetical protein
MLTPNIQDLVFLSRQSQFERVCKTEMREEEEAAVAAQKLDQMGRQWGI